MGQRRVLEARSARSALSVKSSEGIGEKLTLSAIMLGRKRTMAMHVREQWASRMLGGVCGGW